MRIRTWVSAAAVVVAGLAGTVVPATAGTGAGTTGTATGAGAEVVSRHSAPPVCDTDDLQASYRSRGGAAGSVYGVIRLRNTSDAACTTGGYGGISYVGGGDGTQVGAPAVRRGRDAVRRLVLEPGDVATSRVRETQAGAYGARCRERDVDGFRVYVPDETRSQFVAHPTTGCANPRVHLLSQRPYR